jgi:hypothetical protein
MSADQRNAFARLTYTLKVQRPFEPGSPPDPILHWTTPMSIRKLASSLQLAVLPYFPSRIDHGRGVSHPLVSLILLILILALVYWTFRRKTS